MAHRHRRAPNGSDVRQNWQMDVTPVCRTVPCYTRDEWDMLDDDYLMEAIAADGQNMYKLYQRVVSSDEEDCCDSDVADLECLTYLGRDCIMDFSAGGTLSPSVSDLSGPRSPYVTDGPVGHIGTLSPSTPSSEILVDPGWTLPSADRPGCPRLYLLAGGGHCPRPTLTLLARMARLLLVAPSAILGRCPRRPSRRRYW